MMLFIVALFVITFFALLYASFPDAKQEARKRIRDMEQRAEAAIRDWEKRCLDWLGHSED